MAVLLGTASAQITLDIGQFMANARTAEGAMNELASAGTGTRGPNFLDRLGTSALALGTALVVPMGIGLKAAVDLEQAIANVDAALGDVDDSALSRLTAGFQDLGAASQFSAIEVAAVGEGLAKAGFDDTELLNVTEAVINLSQATGDGLEPAMTSVVAAMSIWSEETVGLENALTDATQVADIMTVAANNSTASIGDINAGMRQLGPVAASMGVGFDEAAAAIALFTNYGLTGADAGVSLARGLTNLSDPTSEAATLMDELGIAAFDMQGNFIGFPALFDQLQTSMSGMSDEAQLMALSTIFGAEAMDVMGLAILSGSDPLEAMIGLMQESGAAAEQSAIRMDTLGAQFGTLKEGINTFLGSLVSGLIPGLRIFVDMANQVIDVLMRIPAPIKTIIGTIAGLLAGFASIAAAIRTFQALNLLLGGMGIASSGIAAGLGSVVVPLLLIGAALAGIGWVAWQRNILGVQDRLRDLGTGIKRFTSRFLTGYRNLTEDVIERTGFMGGTITRGMATIPALFLAFGNALARVGDGIPVLEDVGQAMVRLGNSVLYGADVFDYFREQGLDPVQAGLRALGIMFPEVSGLADSLQIIVGRLTQAFQQFMAGDFSGAVASLGSAAQEAISGLSGLVATVFDWVLEVGVPTVTGWVVDIAGDVWGGIVAAAGFVWDGLAELGAWTLNTATPAIAGWVATAAGNIWDAVKATAGFVWEGLVDLGAWTLSVPVPEITGWVAGDLWEAIKAASGWTWTGLQDLGAWTLSVPVPAITGWTGNIAATIAAEIGLQDFTAAGTTTRDKVVAAISAAFSSGEAVGGAAGAGITGLGNLAQSLADAINEMDFNAVGQVVGRKITESIALVAAGGLSFEALKGAFFTGITDALAGVSWSSVGMQFWHLFEAVLSAPTDFVSGVGEGIGSALLDAVNGIDYSGIAATISLKISSAITAVEGFATGLGSTLGSELTQAIGYVDWSGIGGTIKDGLVGAVTGVGQAIWDAIWGGITGGAENADWDGLAPDRLPDDEPVEPPGIPASAGRGIAFKRLIDPAEIANADRLRTALEGLNAVAASVGPAFANLNASVAGSMNALIATMTNSAATAVTATEAIFAGLGAGIAASMAGVTAAVQGAMNGVVAAFANGGALAAASLQNALAPIPAMVQAVGTRAGASALLGGLLIAQGFRNGAALAPGMVASALAAIPGIVSSIGGRAAAAAFAVGANIGNAMAAGMRSALGQIQAAASAMVAAAQTALAAAAMISSPSKLFFGLGEYVSEGFALGIRSGIPAAAMAASDLVYVPNTTPGQYMTPATYGGGGGGAVVINAPVTIEGNVTTERQIIGNAATAISEALTEELIRNRVAAGVS